MEWSADGVPVNATWYSIQSPFFTPAEGCADAALIKLKTRTIDKVAHTPSL
jgi:hypothetical protein